jgi:phage tail P2-like protein
VNNILPQNATLFEKAFCVPFLKSALPQTFPRLWSPEHCPEQLLPWLAWTLSVDEWDPNWPLAVRRAQIKNAPIIHRKKGTVAAVKATVAAFGGSILVREWWQNSPKTEPHTFSLTIALSEVAGQTPTPEYLAQVVSAVNSAKPLRSWFTFTLALSTMAKMAFVGIARSVSFARFDAVFMPQGGENLVYLTDQDGRFLTDQDGHLLIAS